MKTTSTVRKIVTLLIPITVLLLVGCGGGSSGDTADDGQNGVVPQTDEPGGVDTNPYSVLFGTITFDYNFFSDDTLYEDVVIFSESSLANTTSGTEILISSNQVGREARCIYVESTDQFICYIEFPGGSRDWFLFGMDATGISTGNYEFCSSAGNDSCESAAVSDRLINDPDGEVRVTVTPEQLASLRNIGKFNGDDTNYIRIWHDVESFKLASEYEQGEIVVESAHGYQFDDLYQSHIETLLQTD